MPCSRSSTMLTMIAAAATSVAATGCTSLSAPFNGMKDSQMTVYRLQNYVQPAQPAQAAAPAGLQLPPQIQQWIQAGASLLPPGLLPPGSYRAPRRRRRPSTRLGFTTFPSWTTSR